MELNLYAYLMFSVTLIIRLVCTVEVPGPRNVNSSIPGGETRSDAEHASQISMAV